MASTRDRDRTAVDPSQSRLTESSPARLGEYYGVGIVGAARPVWLSLTSGARRTWSRREISLFSPSPPHSRQNAWPLRGNVASPLSKDGQVRSKRMRSGRERSN